VGYLTTLSAWRLHSVGDGMINEYGAVGGIGTGKGKPKYSGETCPSATLYNTVTVTLRPTVSPSWCRDPSGAHDQMVSIYGIVNVGCPPDEGSVIFYSLCPSIVNRQ
jgi:hypothetical protein